jgi:hypothetical protein
MTEVTCAACECKYNDNGICVADEINLSQGNIVTVHEGRQDVWWCKMFEMSDYAKEIHELLKKVGIRK